MSSIEELKNEAADLGIKHHPNISESKLQDRINEHYEAQETSGAAVLEAVAKVEQEKNTKQPVNASITRMDSATSKRIARQAAARATRIVTIIDNDQRVNNQTTTCTCNCSNEFFDLGTVVLPLNEKIEVSQGHINTLREVKIPQHMRDSKTGLATVKMRPRYTISYEDIKSR